MGVVELLWQGSNRGHPDPVKPEVARREEGAHRGRCLLQISVECLPYP